MIKVDIVNEVSKLADITKVKAEVAVDAVFDAMRLSMQRGERIELRGFGVFQVKPRKRGIGRNPRTARKCVSRPAARFVSNPARTYRTSTASTVADSLAPPLGTELPTTVPLRESNSFPLSPSEPPSPHEPHRWTRQDFTPSISAKPHRRRPWVNALLFVATIATTTLFGSLHYEGFVSDFEGVARSPVLLWHGLWYSVTILAILGAHEFGHYFACRYYRVDASLPYFLPAPFLTGTLGAFIRIRQPIPTKRMLFDIGVAGPIAGFLVAVPALFIGLSLSRVLPLPQDFVGLSLGEPLLFRFAAWSIWGSAPDGFSLNLHPVAFAAWFGLLATALNLFPIGQLDGGHISYAALGGRSTLVTVTAAIAVVLLTFQSSSWIAWAVLMIVMLVAFGPRHPRTLDHHVPLDDTRRLIAIAALAIFILCFTPAPIEFTGPTGQ